MTFLRKALLTSLLPLGALAAFHSNTTACTRTYTVQSGDTCDSIGQKTLTSTFQILALNLLDAGADCYNLEIGSQLCLGRFGNDCQFVHTCRGQDNCDSIANQYGISQDLLKDNNPILDCNVVYDGLVLCVSSGSIRPPADNSINSTMIHIQREMQQQRIQQEQAAAASSQSNKKNNKGGNQRNAKLGANDSKASKSGKSGAQSKDAKSKHSLSKDAKSKNASKDDQSEGKHSKGSQSKRFESKDNHSKDAKDRHDSKHSSSHDIKAGGEDEQQPSKSQGLSNDLKEPSNISSALGTNSNDARQLEEKDCNQEEDEDDDQDSQPTRSGLASHRRRRFTA